MGHGYLNIKEKPDGTTPLELILESEALGRIITIKEAMEMSLECGASPKGPFLTRSRIAYLEGTVKFDMAPENLAYQKGTTYSGAIEISRDEFHAIPSEAISIERLYPYLSSGGSQKDSVKDNLIWRIVSEQDEALLTRYAEFSEQTRQGILGNDLIMPVRVNLDYSERPLIRHLVLGYPMNRGLETLGDVEKSSALLIYEK